VRRAAAPARPAAAPSVRRGRQPARHARARRYDGHRDAILRRSRAEAEADAHAPGRPPPDEPDLFPFFSASCFSGYSDGPKARSPGAPAAGPPSRPWPGPAGSRAAARGFGGDLRGVTHTARCGASAECVCEHRTTFVLSTSPPVCGMCATASGGRCTARRQRGRLGSRPVCGAGVSRRAPGPAHLQPASSWGARRRAFTPCTAPSSPRLPSRRPRRRTRTAAAAPRPTRPLLARPARRRMTCLPSTRTGRRLRPPRTLPGRTSTTRRRRPTARRARRSVSTTMLPTACQVQARAIR
jgi:hypothetical protein